MQNTRRSSDTFSRAAIAMLALLVILAAGISSGAASADRGDDRGSDRGDQPRNPVPIPDITIPAPVDTTPAGDDTVHVGGVDTGIKHISPAFAKSTAPVQQAGPSRPGTANRPPRLGDTRVMLALDDAMGQYYLKEFTLRGTSTGAEVWVANDLNFPGDDCRNGVRTTITNGQIQYMLGQFDNNIRPIDTDWFGEPERRYGRDGLIIDLLDLTPRSYYSPFGKDIILVDNVRDANFYDTDNQNSLSYIAGFFSTIMPQYLDRNVITIDAYDWLHRTGENPPHEPTTDPCTSAPARPFLYEGVFAHEYQHLIHSDYDPDEFNWVNEGLSDFAEVLTGYSDPSKHVDEEGSDSHTTNFQGWAKVFHESWNSIPRLNAGPENSLTVWGDQGDGEILADYGHAYYFMTYLAGQGYNQAFFTDWAHHPLNGIDGLNAALADVGSTDTFASLFGDLQVSVLTDGFVDSGAGVFGSTAGALQNPSANSTIHFTGDAYDTPGAPPWGSDFIPLGSGDNVGSVVFNGADEFTFPQGPEWVVNGNGYFSVVPSGNYPPGADLSIAHEVNIGGSSQLTFEHFYDIEQDWDFGFVQISQDGGQTWESLACPGTTSQHDPAALAAIVDNLPGYSGVAGSAGAPISVACDLTGYSGDVIIAFRFMSDGAVEFPGWFVRNIQVDGGDVGTPGSLEGWNNVKAYASIPLGFHVQLVGINGTVNQFGHITSASAVTVVQLPLDAANDGSLGEGLGSLGTYDNVFAIVSGLPETEDNGIYGPYSLIVNGSEVADGIIAVNPW